MNVTRFFIFHHYTIHASLSFYKDRFIEYIGALLMVILVNDNKNDLSERDIYTKYITSVIEIQAGLSFNFWTK